MSGFLEKYDYHYVFSIEPKFEGPPVITVFRKFTSEEFRAAMVDRLHSNIDSSEEITKQEDMNDAFKKIQEELQMLKIRSMYNKSSSLLCIHSNNDLNTDDIQKYVQGVESIDQFIKDAKLETH
ncbi:MAG: hypothetical protein KAS32_26285 [Candidatus Peribacteraceae bacterium]|nr:hypothetical protein [Candidatus Peribacteraceae bacterium]